MFVLYFYVVVFSQTNETIYDLNTKLTEINKELSSTQNEKVGFIYQFVWIYNMPCMYKWRVLSLTFIFASKNQFINQLAEETGFLYLAFPELLHFVVLLQSWHTVRCLAVSSITNIIFNSSYHSWCNLTKFLHSCFLLNDCC